MKQSPMIILRMLLQNYMILLKIYIQFLFKNLDTEMRNIVIKINVFR